MTVREVRGNCLITLGKANSRCLKPFRGISALAVVTILKLKDFFNEEGLKIPLSTTHCQVGATVGVGLLENHRNCSGINCKVFYKTAFGWIITCIIVGLTSALLVAQGVYAPSLIDRPCNYTNITI